MKKAIKLTAICAAIFVVVGAISGALYWQYLKSTPQYSLALLLDASRNDDRATVDSLVDIDAVVDDFLPQVTDKAVELYGRGLPPILLAKVTSFATPAIPAIKERARAELPGAIRERTKKLGDAPFFATVLGANRYLDIKFVDGNAVVRSKREEDTFEVTMKKTDNRWKVVAVKDEKLASDIARKIGQELIGVISAEGTKTDGLSDLLKKVNKAITGDK